jgi:hypothetical protein
MTKSIDRYKIGDRVRVFLNNDNTWRDAVIISRTENKEGWSVCATYFDTTSFHNDCKTFTHVQNIDNITPFVDTLNYYNVEFYHAIENRDHESAVLRAAIAVAEQAFKALQLEYVHEYAWPGDHNFYQIVRTTLTEASLTIQLGQQGCRVGHIYVCDPDAKGYKICTPREMFEMKILRQARELNAELDRLAHDSHPHAEAKREAQKLIKRVLKKKKTPSKKIKKAKRGRGTP